MHRIHNFQLGGPEKLIGADDPRHALQETEAWQTSGTLMMVTSCAIQRWYCPNLQAFDTANAKIEAERTPQNTEVIYSVSDLDTALLDWKINEVGPVASVDTAVHGDVTDGPHLPAR